MVLRQNVAMAISAPVLPPEIATALAQRLAGLVVHGDDGFAVADFGNRAQLGEFGHQWLEGFFASVKDEARVGALAKQEFGPVEGCARRIVSAHRVHGDRYRFTHCVP
jgi:hypothetical protein